MAQAMPQRPYRCAQRVFWIMDNRRATQAFTPNDFRSLSELQDRLLAFQEHYQSVAQPFQWRFTRRDLRRLMAKLTTVPDALAQAA